MKGESKADWETIDKEIITKLEEIAGKGGAIRIVSNTILSPSTRNTIDKFKTKYPTTEHIEYDPISAYGILKANEELFVASMIPSYDFSKAKTIVSIGADFLGTWIFPIEFVKQYATTSGVSDNTPSISPL